MVSVDEIGTPRGSKSSRSKYLSSQRGQVYDDEVATSLPDCISVYSPDGSERPTSVPDRIRPIYNRWRGGSIVVPSHKTKGANLCK